MTWKEVCEDKSLADLPYKIELNGFGQILMSPIYKPHDTFTMRIGTKLAALLPHGEPTGESPIKTSDGMRSPDVAWASDERHGQNLGRVWTLAPEICVEIVSKSNTRKELEVKRRLYFEAGAVEVWLCDSKGNLRFFTPQGEIPKSALCPAFPISVAKKSARIGSVD